MSTCLFSEGDFHYRYSNQILEGKQLFSYNASIYQVRYAKKSELNGSGSSNPQANIIRKTEKPCLSSIVPAHSLVT